MNVDFRRYIFHGSQTFVPNTSIMLAYSTMLAVAILSLFIGCILGLVIRSHRLNALSFSEAAVAEMVEANVSGFNVLLNDLTIETAHGTTQIDHILVCETGIFVIETKHYSGWIFGDPNSPTWTQVIYKKKTRFQNPILQNAGHVKTVQSLFTLPPEAFHSIVVFTGDATFKTGLGPSVMHLHQLTEFLRSDTRPIIFDERKIAYVVGRIEMKRMRRSMETKEYHINSVRTRLGKKKSRSFDGALQKPSDAFNHCRNQPHHICENSSGA